MEPAQIVIKGARVHNLQEVEVWLPRNRLICLTGVSGSGKSSLAFDTLYAEGQRRYMESLSVHARQWLNQLPRPEADSIEGLSPAIAIGQQTSGWNPRSTVGTITAVYDLLRVLFARVGQPHCPRCGRRITSQSPDQIAAAIEQFSAVGPVIVLAPVVRGQRGHWRDLFEQLRRDGYLRARVDGAILPTDPPPNLDRNRRHNIEVVIDRLPSRASKSRIAEALEQALKLGQGQLILTHQPQDQTRGGSPTDRILSTLQACKRCGIGLEALSPQLFSFNSPSGMCLACDGLGERHDFDADLLVAEPQMSLLEGAIPALRPPIGRWRRHIYRTVARWAGGDLRQPWKALPKRARDALLYGTGDAELLFTWHSYYGIWRRREPFEGILAELREKYKTTSSGIMRRFYEKFMRRRTCQACGGARLNHQALAVRIDGKNIAEVCNLSIEQLHAWLGVLRLEGSSAIVAEDLLKELRSRLGFLLDVGLGYLTLSRPAPTLSGGEAQRVRLAGQIGGGLVGALYVLDEPSVGLHARDNARLLRTLGRLRDMGNTVVVVEHDEATIRSADYVVDFGPGPGVHGGKVVAAGSLGDICRAKESITGQYLRGRRRIEIPRARRKPRRGQWLRVIGASHNNLKRINVAIPLGCFVCVTGVSGSGKSSLVNDTIARRLRRDVNGAHTPEPGKHRDIRGLDKIDKVLLIDQSPIGRTPRSNPATYIKVFDLIRALYSRLPDARVRGYKPGRFSFNVPAEAGGGRCEACQGHGANKLEMDFLADVWVSCALCQGRRFATETLQIHYKGKSIADVLEMTVEQAAEHFSNIPKIRHMLQCLIDVGLGYITLGQPSTTLSGGEAQRIKLGRELVKRSTGKTLYILDEPTTGLHFEDVKKLLHVLHGFVDAGNTVLIVEHNPDIIKTADWIIDLGPEGGDEGGYIVATGTPEDLARCEQSYTGQVLRAVLGIGGDGKAGIRSVVRHRPIRPKRRNGGNGRIRIVGARQNNLKDVTVSLPRGRMTVCTGVSGSGKTSLALETVYNEGQRRYVESLSAYARQFVGRLAKPKVERIEGLSPAIAIEQKGAARSPRSTVATITEIYDYMRLLWARLGEPYCPSCQQPVQQMTVDEIADDILRRLRGRRALIFAPVAPGAGQRWADLIRKLKEAGFTRLRLDGRLDRIEQLPTPAEGQHHSLQVAIDRLDVAPSQRSRLIDSIEQAVALSDGMVSTEPAEGHESFRYSVRRSCRACGKAFEELSPHHFSFNSPLGWCEVCEGLGTQQGADPEALILRPEKGLLDGAILGWGRIGRDSPLGKMLSALAERLGFDPSTPWRDLTDSQRSAILYGVEGDWIDAAETWPNLRFQFKGLFPAIEQATRISWHYRKRLEHLAREVPCRACKASRLRPDAAAVRLAGKTIGEVCSLPLNEALQFFGNLSLPKHQRKIGAELLREIRNRLAFLVDVGLDYLTLARPGPTLSGGEAQRIRLACQLGSGLTGVLYVLDEPTIGLHPADNRRLLDALRRLRDLGNTLLLIEHDREVIRAADHILDFGPGAGQAGGRIVAAGSAKRLERSRSSLTGKYLAGKEAIAVPVNRRPVQPYSAPQRWLIVRGARHNNLKGIDAAFPLGRFTCITGVSGSGKSSLINDTLWPAIARRLHGGQMSPGPHERIDGIEHIDKVICVDQSPIGQTPASNAATYTHLFDEIRKLFARLPASRMRGFTAGRFSFNRPGGRCEACEGLGAKCVQMHFLPDVWITCEDCGGKRFNAATLEVTYRGKNIAEVLQMSVAEATELFAEVPKISRILQTLLDVGLGYLPLGQSATTLSGGEAQRIKLAAELARPQTGRTLYILDEPTTGLHFDDLAKLLVVLHRLVDLGNTVICVEHNLDLIKQADWIIDLGPGPADRGGEIVIADTPERLAQCPRSQTGRALREALQAGPHRPREVFDPHKHAEAVLDRRARQTARLQRSEPDQQMPWQRDGEAWHLEQRHEAGQIERHWDSDALRWLIRQVERLAGKRFGPTDYNDPARIEIRAIEASEPGEWFLHALTGGADVLDVSFRVPAGTFEESALRRRLKIKTLDERPDVSIRGDFQRVHVRPTGQVQQVRVQIYDLKDIKTAAFSRFLAQAAKAYLQWIREKKKRAKSTTPAAADRKVWHLSGRAIATGKRPIWSRAALAGLCGLLSKYPPQARIDWSGKTGLAVRAGAGRRCGWIATNRAEAIQVRLTCRADAFTPTEVEAIGAGGTIEYRSDGLAEVRFTLTHESQLDTSTRAFLKRWARSLARPGKKDEASADAALPEEQVELWAESSAPVEED